MPPPGTVILLGLVGVVGYLAITALQATEQSIAAEVRAEHAPEPLAEQTTQARNERSDDFYLVLAARPLFSETRKPMVIATPVQPEPAPVPQSSAPQLELKPAVVHVPPELKIRGLIVAETNRSALIEWSSGQAEWYQIADEIDGWSITEISSNSVSITRDGSSSIYFLFERGATSRDPDQ
ncbi:MAG: hypothetical protein AAGC79_13155 [Pseudomonadota bacterium]